MNDIQIIRYNSIPVITTKQVAEAYGATTKRVSNNFNANKARYTEGKHYFKLSGEEKTKFLNRPENEDALNNRPEIRDASKKANFLYLWTERGALLLAKSINTDTAWEAYERLVDFYFEKKEESPQLPEIQHPSIPTVSSTPVPLVSDWYSKHKSRIWEICNARNTRPKTLYHYILLHIGETYDITAARAIYKKEKGYPPMNAIDIIGYFPELEQMADEYMDRLL